MNDNSSQREVFMDLNHVTKTYQKGLVTALDDFSCKLYTDDVSITSVVGESGSGKSTLCQLMLGLIPPSSGEIKYRGIDLRSLSKTDKRSFRQEVQFIFQDPFGVYNPFYPVDHLLNMAVDKFGLAKTKDEKRELLEQSLLSVGLKPDEILGRYPHQLSGGQRQRVTIARIFLIKPRFIIADEPISMVDAALRMTILENLQEMTRVLGNKMFYITHDLATAYKISKDIYVLYRGSVVEKGNVRKVIESPAHPYTKMLIDSIPIPDPNIRWSSEDNKHTDELDEKTVMTGCKFANRCKFSEKRCFTEKPNLYSVQEGQSVACLMFKK